MNIRQLKLNSLGQYNLTERETKCIEIVKSPHQE